MWKNRLLPLFVRSEGTSQFPPEVDFRMDSDTAPSKWVHAKVHYGIHLELQKKMEKAFETSRPDYGAFVALDAATGQILSLVSYSKDKKVQTHLALKASFPCASIFKIVTATAALESQKVSTETLMPFIGRYHTLYRGQILMSGMHPFTQYMSFKKAFGSSINSIFGRIGAVMLGADRLRAYANRFGFDQKIESDLPIEPSHAWIPEDFWGLAESSSGFTQENTMSPIQGALIAASVVNDGIMMEPYLIESLSEIDLSSLRLGTAGALEGTLLYTAEPKVAAVTMTPTTAASLKTMMEETVLHGTSRQAFRGFFDRDSSYLSVGGKTGSLKGLDPLGKYDWFVGYADSGFARIAIATLMIHRDLWRVKASALGRLAIETYFKKSRKVKNLVVKLHGKKSEFRSSLD